MQLPKTTIIATIGPSTWDDEVLTHMINHGMGIARVNTSFADFAEMERVLKQIRNLSPRVSVMLDTMGPKILITGVKETQNLTKGDKISLVSKGNKAKNAYTITYDNLENDVRVGSEILIDNAQIRLEVTGFEGSRVDCVVKNGGKLINKKTVNIPNVHLDIKELSKKDREDIQEGVRLGYDLISASFIRNTNDVKLVRDAMGETDTKLVAKIEDAEGVKNYDEILNQVDAIMVARGDLGVEMNIEKIPLIQKEMIYKARCVGKPVIVATEMLESMKDNIRPTRAEVSDVANAIMDGTDCIMLSAETSIGKHPKEAVQTMYKTALECENALTPQLIQSNTDAPPETDVICRHVFNIADELSLSGIIILSDKMSTIASVSRHRPQVPIWAINNNPKLIRQMQLFRGVNGYYIRDFKIDRDKAIKQAISVVFGNGFLELSDKVAVICGSTVNNKCGDTILEIVDVSRNID